MVASYPEFVGGYGTEANKDDDLLRRSFANTPDSRWGTAQTEPAGHSPLDGSSDFYEYSFELTPQNIRALWRTNFEWDSGSMKAAVNCLLNSPEGQGNRWPPPVPSKRVFPPGTARRVRKLVASWPAVPKRNRALRLGTG